MKKLLSTAAVAAVVVVAAQFAKRYPEGRKVVEAVEERVNDFAQAVMDGFNSRA